ncbi:hypothetical protein MTR_5g089180 [Medicago truncatula]|uniref:Uncharacterized protein n=1 Tax=Medicago truncatula TaxID=3880 RepID=G7KCV8_MEDTR|nr:hypothetical protein MTR_5g089180 [Medicago truncatula]
MDRCGLMELYVDHCKVVRAPPRFVHTNEITFKLEDIEVEMFYRVDMRPHEAIIFVYVIQLMCSQVAPAEFSLLNCTFYFQMK